MTTAELKVDATGCDPPTRATTSEEAASTIATLEHAAWALAARAPVPRDRPHRERADCARWRRSGAGATARHAGPADRGTGGFRPGTGSGRSVHDGAHRHPRRGAHVHVRQIATVTGIVAKGAGGGWATFDDETLSLRETRRRSPGGCWRRSPSATCPVSTDASTKAAGSWMSARAWEHSARHLPRHCPMHRRRHRCPSPSSRPGPQPRRQTRPRRPRRDPPAGRRRAR